MELDTNQHGVIQLEKVYNPICLKTNDGETMHICMRDSGFEFHYQGKWYEAKEGIVQEMKSSSSKAKEGEDIGSFDPSVRK